MGMIGRIFGWLFRLGLALLAITLVAVIYLASDMRAEHLDGRSLEEPVDVIIVLGAMIDGDGRLGYSSRRRAETAARLIVEGKAGAAILSGGPGPSHVPEPASVLMRRLAIEAGAPAESLIVEDRSVSTFENLRYSFAIAEDRGFTRIAVLTDPFHLPRAQALSAYYGHGDVALIAAKGFEYDPWHVQAVTLIREALAWWLNLAKVGGWEMLEGLDVDRATRERLIR